MRKHVFKVCGINVYFPYEEPYPAQVAIMASTINALRKSQNAILESPTGTGKSISLLAAALAYQKSYKKDIREEIKEETDYFGFFPPKYAQNAGQPIFDPILTSDIDPREVPVFTEKDKEDNSNVQYRKNKIWYATRTHKQLKQLVSELKNLSYHPKMSVLASRKRLCINEKALRSENIEEACFKLINDSKCPFYIKSKISGVPPEFHRYGDYEKFEIEELKDFCIENGYCPYEMSHILMKGADIVFCPYNYFLDPKIKSQMRLYLYDSIVIIDEAHNVEGACRENGSLHITNAMFKACLSYIYGQLKIDDEKKRPSPTKWKSLFIIYDFLRNQVSWFESILMLLNENHQCEYVAPNIDEILNKWGLTEYRKKELFAAFDCILKYAHKINIPEFIKKEELNEIPKVLMDVIEQLWVVISFLFEDDGKNRQSFSIAVTTNGRDNNSSTLHCICLNPGIVFKIPAEEAKSIILASGTMSPLETFAKELMQSFPIKLSAPHVIDESQIIGFTITKSLKNIPLTSSYSVIKDEIDKTDIFISVGEILLKLLPAIPNGILFFVNSHSTLEQIIRTWKNNNIYQKIQKIKPIFAEKSEINTHFFDSYKAQALTEQGALLMGVFRGRSSEGIDFIDEQARAVFSFGIPYPNCTDLDVKLKKQFNDTYINGGGSEWYMAQAYRALFQALGRVIRTKNDYGAVILIDERFPKVLYKFPKWMKPSIKTEESIDTIAKKLSRFYATMNIRFSTGKLLKAGSPVTLYCASCKKKIFEIGNLLTNEAEMLNAFSKFGKFVFAEGDEFILFIKLSQGDSLNIWLDDELYIKEEKTCYRRILCKCGRCIGAKVFATTSEKMDELGGYKILLQRVNTVEKEEFVKVKCPLKNKLKEKEESFIE